MKKRTCAKLSLVLLIALLTLQAAITVTPTLAHDPVTDQVSAKAEAQADGTPPQIDGPNYHATSARAQASDNKGGNSALAHIRVWKDSQGVIRSNGQTHVTGNGYATVIADPVGRPMKIVWQIAVKGAPGSAEGDAVGRVTLQDASGTETIEEIRSPPGGGRRNGLRREVTRTTTGTAYLKFEVTGSTTGSASGSSATIVIGWVEVGGVAISPDKLALLAPLIILGAALPITIASIAIYKKKHRQ